MTLIKTKFGFNSTADEVAEGINLTGKRAIVTGAASGLGIETARALAKTGADVTIAVRNIEAGDKAAEDIIASTNNKLVHVAKLDLTDRASINAFASEWESPIHILVNNAGVMAIPELQRTTEGWEMQFATNHLGHFILALRLHDALAKDGSARIVAVSSSGHVHSPVIFDDIHFKFRPYDQWLAYGQSKTANILFAIAASKHWAKDGITVNALNPGAILTNLQRYVGNRLRTAPEFQKTPQQGAATSVLLATSPQLEGIGGHYFEDCNEAEVIYERSSNYHGVTPYALDINNAERLWDESLRMLAD